MASVSLAHCRNVPDLSFFWGTLILRAPSTSYNTAIAYNKATCFAHSTNTLYKIKSLVASSSDGWTSIIYTDSSQRNILLKAHIDFSNTVYLSELTFPDTFDFVSATSSPAGGSTRDCDIVLKFVDTP